MILARTKDQQEKKYSSSDHNSIITKLTLLVNFGGPRSPEEIEPFLCELLTDHELIRQKLPTFLHNRLFRRIAKKRARLVRTDYELIGGASPIFEQTERLAKILHAQTFHRYLTSTHEKAFQIIEETQGDLHILPLFPQFSYTTTGSIASLFSRCLSRKKQTHLRWIKSYPAHPAFIRAHSALLKRLLEEHQLLEEQIFFLFSAHGIPQSFADEGDPYPFECEQTAKALLASFPKALGVLAYQSQFGPEEWIRPYTKDVSQKILNWNRDRPIVIIVPLSFTSDHLETLFEIEYLYLPLIAQQGLRAIRCPALNLEPEWIVALQELLQEQNFCTNDMLVRKIVAY